MMSVSVAEILKNRCRTMVAEPMEANACETALYRGSRRLFRPRPGRPKRTYNGRMAAVCRLRRKTLPSPSQLPKADATATFPESASDGIAGDRWGIPGPGPVSFHKGP